MTGRCRHLVGTTISQFWRGQVSGRVVGGQCSRMRMLVRMGQVRMRVGTGGGLSEGSGSCSSRHHSVIGERVIGRLWRQSRSSSSCSRGGRRAGGLWMCRQQGRCSGLIVVHPQRTVPQGRQCGYVRMV